MRYVIKSGTLPHNEAVVKVSLNALELYSRDCSGVQKFHYRNSALSFFKTL